MGTLKKYIRLLRIKSYVKNGLILLPAVFGKRLFDPSFFPLIVLALISFCAVSSAVYIFNDLCDCERDKLHPHKCTRPLASGEITFKTAIVTAVILLIISVAANYFACGTTATPWLLLLLYLVQNILYSVKLKKIPVLDVAVLVLGFLIRVFYGAEIAGISVSNWLYLTVLAISFYLGLSKRRNEISVSESTDSRSVLCFYSYDFLDKNMYVCSALAIVFYSLWCIDPTTIANFGSNRLMWTIPLVILICICYSHAVEKRNTDDPIDVIFKNKALIILGLLYCASVLFIIYV